MFLKLLSLVVEAVKVGIEHWRSPVQTSEVPNTDAQASVAAPVAKSEPVAVPTPGIAPPKNRWESPAFHMQALDATECPDCGKAKALKAYRCAPCHKVAVKARGVLRAT